MTFQPLPGLLCVTDGFGKCLLLAPLLHASRLSTPWLAKEKRQVRVRERRQPRKRAKVKCQGFHRAGRLWELWQLPGCSGGQSCTVSISLSRLLIIRMQNHFKCCHGGTVSLAFQNSYRITWKKKSHSPHPCFLSTHMVN